MILTSICVSIIFITCVVRLHVRRSLDGLVEPSSVKEGKVERFYHLKIGL